MWKEKKKKHTLNTTLSGRSQPVKLGEGKGKKGRKLTKKKEMNKAYRNKKHDKTMLIFRMT